MRESTRGWLAAAALILGATAQAQDATILRVQSLAATCAQCHGTDGHAPAGAVAVPGLAGMPADRLIAQMQAFKNGSRSATVMPQIAKGYSDARIAQLAAYFAAQQAAR